MQQALDAIGEACGGFGLYVSLGGDDEEGGERGTKFGGCAVGVFQELGDAAGDRLGFAGIEEGLVFAGVVVAEAEGVGGLREDAAAAVGVGEVTEIGAIGIAWHGILREKVISNRKAFTVGKRRKGGSSPVQSGRFQERAGTALAAQLQKKKLARKARANLSMAKSIAGGTEVVIMNLW